MNPTKRARLDPPTAAKAPPFVSPTLAAETSAAAAAASSLPTTLTPYATDMATTVIKAYRSLHDHTTTLKNVENGPATPRSARVNFTLTTQRRFEQEEEFKALQSEADDEVAKYHAAMKSLIVKKLNFEVRKMKEEADKAAISAAFRLTMMLLVANGATDDDDDIHTSRPTKSIVQMVFSNPTVQIIMGSDTTGLINQQSAAPLEEIAPQELPIAAKIMEAVKDVLILPIQVYRDKETENQLNSRLRRIAMSNTVEKAAATTAMAVDEEATAPPDSIRDEIQKQVTAATKTLHSQVKKLANNLKKDHGGPARSGASTTKKNNPPKTRRNQGQAGENNRDTGLASSRKKKNRKKQPSRATTRNSAGNSGN